MRTTHRAPTQKIKIMGLFDGLGSSVIGSFLSGIFGSRQQKRNLQAQQRENSVARQFNAQQAALTRQFNSAEAEKSRQFQERMYQLYESPIAQAQQRQQAGLPMEATSMSVGSSSTASASPASTSPASLPAPPSPWFDLGESVKQLPFIRHQIRASILDNQQRELEQEKTRAETFKTWQEGYQTQIENGFTAEEKRAIIDDLIASKDKKGSDKKLIDQQIEFIENAKEAGVNPVIDASNESKARIEKINAEIKKITSDIDTAKLDSDLRQAKGEYELNILKNDKYFSNLNYAIHKCFGVDISNVPQYVSARILALFRAYTTLANGGRVVSDGKELSYNDIVSMAKDVVHKYYSHMDSINFNNSTAILGSDASTIMGWLK